MTQDLEDCPFFFFSVFPLGYRAISPFLVLRAGKSDSCRGPNDEKQGREIVMVCARWSNWARAGVDRGSEWALIRHQRSALSFGIGEDLLGSAWIEIIVAACRVDWRTTREHQGPSTEINAGFQ